ncbi:MAG: LacI family DNA-binding transcriptional regulator [Spirochaetes bacterium]|uniref:LacI family DNA-binding transcriptional regulator n=1 Tax=Candidatus Avitreponema avistercoris TaxID=2840705 RepID=A0A9D9HDL8_9SPIR|nr:LacI family DNA-binding transcriptional regulator [Candidatus Avitreponema avistercoris]
MKDNREKHATQNDVAKLAGVTRSLVSYVLNGTDRAVAPETRKKILQAIDELGYRPNRFAQALLAGKAALAKNHLGVILPSPAMLIRPYYTEILSGIFTAAHRAGNHIRFLRFFSELENPALFNSLIHEEEISGLILVGPDQIPVTGESAQILDRIRGRIPQVVTVDSRAAGFSSVVFDRREAGYKATGRLLRRGCSPVLYIGQMDERFSGFRQALFEKTGGRPGCGPQVEKERGAVDTAGGYEAIRGFHTEYGTVPGGIFAGSDEIAVGILKFLHEKQIAVPGETALVSIDNLEIAGYTCPALTTVNVHKRQLGEKAVGLILGKAAVSGQDAVTVTLPTEIVERESC